MRHSLVLLISGALGFAPFCNAAPDVPPGCIGSSPLGKFRITVYRPDQSAGLPLKEISTIPPDGTLVWDPVHLTPHLSQKSEIALLVMAQGNSNLATLPARPAGRRETWKLPQGASVIAVVLGPDGLNMGKVKSLMAGDEDLLLQLADYAQQTSEVESLIQQLADSEQSHIGTEAALQGFASQWGVATPKLDAKASTDQQASMLLSTVMPTVSAYDPLSPGSKQVQQTTGLAASVAGLFFGSSVGLAAGGTALVSNLRSALFPNTEFHSAIAQAADDGALAFCAKGKLQAARTRLAYLWAYRVPNAGKPSGQVTGATFVPLGSRAVVQVKMDGADSKQLAHARDWTLVPLAGGDPSSVNVTLGSAHDTLLLDLTKTNAAPGDYDLETTWDWDSLRLGTVHLRRYSDFNKVQMAAVSRNQLVQGRGIVTAKLMGADFEFVNKVELQKIAAKPLKPAQAIFELPKGPGRGEQTAMTVEIDTASAGKYQLLVTQSDGVEHDLPVEVLPPNPSVANLPIRVNTGEDHKELRLTGKGLQRIEAISSDAGEIAGSAADGIWSGRIRLNRDAKAGERYSLLLKVQGLDAPISVPDAIQVVGPKPQILAVRKSQPQDTGIELREDELPAGASLGLVMSVAHLDDPSDQPSGRPKLELACRPGESRKTLTLAPDENAAGASLSFAGPDSLYLSLDPGTIGYPGCELTASISVDPKGSSEPFSLGRVVRLPRLDQFTLTAEQVSANVYAGILKGHDLDVIEKAGWDPDHGLPVTSIPAPVPGDASEQTLRIAVPWPSPSPHALLYIWLRGESMGRKTGVSD